MKCLAKEFADQIKFSYNLVLSTQQKACHYSARSPPEILLRRNVNSDDDISMRLTERNESIPNPVLGIL